MVMCTGSLRVVPAGHDLIPGIRQSVHRGELMALVQAAERPRRSRVYFTDIWAVHDGMWQQLDESPQWPEVSEARYSWAPRGRSPA
eukprot:4654268-Pyramimonas_sp.AAC.1